MARYVDIECDVVTEVIGRRAFKSQEDIQAFLDNIPTADVVEVVRCEKCKDFEPHGNRKAGICRNRKLKPCLRHDTDFCSYGQRK